MRRIEKAPLHNPGLCPFGLVAQGEKNLCLFEWSGPKETKI